MMSFKKTSFQRMLQLSLFLLWSASNVIGDHQSSQKPLSVESQIAILKEQEKKCLLKMVEELQLSPEALISRLELQQLSNMSGGEDRSKTESFMRQEKNLGSATVTDQYDESFVYKEQEMKFFQELVDNNDLLDQIFNLVIESRESLRGNRTDSVLARKETMSTNDTKVQLFCPTTFDNVYCWPKTPANMLASVPCPSYVQGFSSKGRATKQCTAEGVWFAPAGRNTSWTNYSDCQVAAFPTEMDYDLLRWTPIIRSMATAGYAVSLATLLVALMVLISFKNLHCPRNSLHMHLFASFACRAACAICRDQMKFVSHHPQISPEEFYKCRVFTCVWQYCILANYFWILMEGLYLHNLIFLALFNDNSSIMSYVLRGWGFPFILVVMWSIARLIKDNVLCWTTNSDATIFWVFIRGPISISILVSFGLFMQITRELFLKLRSKSTFGGGSRRNSYRQWARSTLVLVPLFGVHYAALLGFGFLGKNSTIELVWLFTDQFFASFQGFFVATLYCLLNGEVRNEVRKVWQRWISNGVLADRLHLNCFNNFKNQRLPRRDSSKRSITSVKPRVALVNSLEMGAYQNHHQKDSGAELNKLRCVTTKELQPMNGSAICNLNKNLSTKSLITPQLSNAGKERSFSVETCVLHVSSSTDLRETSPQLSPGDSQLSKSVQTKRFKNEKKNSLKELRASILLSMDPLSLENLRRSRKSLKFVKESQSVEVEGQNNHLNNNNNNASLKLSTPKNNIQESRMSI